jgi:hypothetical protein
MDRRESKPARGVGVQCRLFTLLREGTRGTRMACAEVGMCPQRMNRDDESFDPTRRWWVPVVKDAADQPMPMDPEASDAYVVVDAILEGRVRLVVAPWPRLDRDGRMHFHDLGRGLGPYAGRNVQALVDRHRAQQGQLPRPLRVGDVFLVRGDPSRLGGWTYVVDVTMGARAQAKVALARAVTPDPEVPARPRSRQRSGPAVQAGAPARPSERVAGSVAPPNL